MHARYFAPEFRVEMNGASVVADVSKNITSVSVTQAPDSIDSLRLTLANPYPALRWTHTKDAELFAEGTALKVWMGYAGAPLELMFDGELTGMTPSFPESGSPTVEVEGYNLLHRLQLKSDVITMVKAKDGAMIEKIAQESGLSAQVEDPGTIHSHLTTGCLTHLKYLMQRAKAVGREVWVQGKTLHFTKPRGRAQPSYTLVWGRTRDAYVEGSLPLQSFSPQLDTRRQVNSVVVRGQHPETRVVFEGRAAQGSEDAILGTGKTGPQVRAAALGGPVEMVVVDEPVRSLAEAQARAQALYNGRAMEFIQGSGATLGLPGLRPGTVVRLDGLGPRFNGRYYVTRSTHSLGGGGYRTSFNVQKNALG